MKAKSIKGRSTNKVKAISKKTLEELKILRSELATRNRELEIESSLERVRNAAMGMKMPVDMLDICRIISNELQNLGIKEIRNIQTAIIDEEKASYLNYEYFRLHKKKTVTTVEYKKQKDVAAFVRKMLKDPDGFFTKTFKGPEIKSWMKYQAESGQFVDPNLKKIKSLHYYFYSIGPGALGISTYAPLNKEAIILFKRFRNVFQLAYRRFIDIQKAEADAREAQIQLALERVRARTMAMQHSDELSETSFVLFQQLKGLGEVGDQISIGIFNEEERVMDLYATVQGNQWERSAKPSIDKQPVMKNIYKAWKEQKKSLVLDLTGAALRDYNKFRVEANPDHQVLKSELVRHDKLIQQERWVIHAAFFSKGMLSFSTAEPRPTETIELLERFAGVFDLTYTRFLDLKNAEARAREAQIEASLERVRAKTMAMHKSSDLLEVVKILGEQLELLSVKFDSVNFNTDYLEKDWNLWLYNSGIPMYPDKLHIPYLDHPCFNRPQNAYKEGIDFQTFVFTKEEKDSLFDHIYANSIARNAPEERKRYTYAAPGLVWSVACGKQTAVTISNYRAEPFSEEENAILRRFANVFEQSYTRFLDLQKAEAQAREAQIEAALEKVRSRSLAMHKSDELQEVVHTVFEKLRELNVDLYTAIIFIFVEGSKDFIWWLANKANQQYSRILVPYSDVPYLKNLLDAKENGKEFFSATYSLEEKNELFHHLFEHTDFKYVPENQKKFLLESQSAAMSVALAKSTGINITSYSRKSFSEDENEILKRFAKVFDQAYTRFLDLQKAEAQAREAQIELGLERVRARAMAMQSSSELSELVDTVFKELIKLDFALTWCIINIIDESSLTNTVWAANPDIDKAPESYHMKFEDYPFHHAMMNGWKERKTKYVYVLEGLEKKVYDEYLFNETEFRKVPEAAQAASRAIEKYVVSFSFSNFGGLQTVGDVPLSDANLDILSRFGKVFDLTYTRFNDLKQAEAQARESQIGAALEKVRSRSLAMHKSDEIKDVVATVMEKMTELNIEINGGVSLVTFTPGSKDFLHWFANPDHLSAPVSLHLPYFDNVIFNDCIDAREKGMDLFAKVYSFEEKIKFFGYVFEQPEFKNLPEDWKMWTMEQPYFGFSFALQKNSGIFLNDYTGKLFSEKENEILKRFSRVFEQAYVRFLDLQKSEAQAREAQIEAVLERVRSRTMAMQRSDELTDVAGVLFEQVSALGIKTWTAGFNVWSEDNNSYIDYITSPNGGFIEPYTVHTERAEALRDISNARKSGVEFDVQYVEGEKIKQLYLALTKLDEKQYEIMLQDGVRFPSHQYEHFVFGAKVSLMFITYEPVPEAHDIFKRLGKVFEQTYTRFLDLQKAEAQAREAQIEAALERVRSKAMAMHKSEDLHAAVAVVFEELDKLNLGVLRCGISVLNKEKRTGDVWVTSISDQGSAVQVSGDESFDIHPLLHGAFEAWLRQEDFYYLLEGDDLINYYKAVKTAQFQLPESQMILTDDSSKRQYCFVAVYNSGGLFAFQETEFSEEAKKVMKRFANVFDLTYKRFLDLQKAEAQAREAQIEASLERVRASAMAMHNSNDISATTNIVFAELKKLDIQSKRCGVALLSKNSRTAQVYAAALSSDGEFHTLRRFIDMTQHPSQVEQYESWLSQKNYISVLSGEELKSYYQLPFFNSSASFIPPEYYDHKEYGYYIPFSEGFFYAWTENPYSDNEVNILNRFKSIIDLTFRRFFDLQKAEAQAREATIEAGMERVRARAMAMHNSSDLSSTASMVFTELRKLGINPIRCGVGLLTKESRKAQLYSATSSPEGDSLSLGGWVMLTGHPVLEEIYNTWMKNEDSYPELSGEQLKSYYELLLAGLSVTVPEWQSGQKQYGHFFSFSVGCLYAWSEVRYNDEEIKILKRFASIIDLTFRRYMDLQKSEASAKEAVKQAALDRIRADIASMRTITDLDRITPLIWNELTILGVPFIRCGVFIMDEEQKLIHTFLSTPDGKAIGAFHLPYTTPGNIQKVLDHWHDKKSYIDHWDESSFTDFADILVKQGALASAEQYLKTIPHGGFYLHFLPFLQGMLYVGNTTQLDDEQNRLVQSVADAFSTAYARYEDFNKLESAKQQIENTLVDLKQTQQQLVQSEKMASLGELTAGIAHEIQNPLNFVNNFSEVSHELLEEMKTELDKGQAEEAKLLADNVKQNLEKILHHGKRADAIVKGMLQHSRTSSGQKELTDINVLADEYLRLAYHGLRAKDKTFNAKFETHLDTTIEKINVVPQEIGRVILNLINNAFYTVSEKKKQLNGTYEPTVSISTKRLDNKIEIKVADNGSGIPQKVMDKIFQPFFTTKPTGQGTGLGLSLAYDIVTKGHGGELKVETWEGHGSAFVISLPLHY